MSAPDFRAHLAECPACRGAWGGLRSCCDAGVILARKAFASRGAERDRLVAEMVRRELGPSSASPSDEQKHEQAPSPDNKLLPTPAPRAAVESVAAALDATPAAVRQAVHRANKLLADAPPPAQMTPGLDVSTALDGIDNHLTAAKRLATQLVGAHPELEDRFPVFQMRSALEQATTLLRGMRPSSGMCLYCKWSDEMPRCGACRGSGWLTADQLIDVPPELRDEGALAGIYIAGAFVLLKDLGESSIAVSPGKGGIEERASDNGCIVAVAGTAAAPSAASKGASKPAISPQPKPQRRVRIVDEAGDDIPLPGEPWDGDAA